MNDGEKRLCEFHIGYMDRNSFFGSLFVTIAKADLTNRARLKLAFPEEVEAHIRYTTEEGYWKKIQAEFKRVKR